MHATDPAASDSTILGSATPGSPASYIPMTAPPGTEQKQLVRAIRLGFAVVLFLTVVLGGIGLFQLYSVNASMSKIVTVNNSKIALASAMRDAIRLRALSINKMLATEDYFKRDQELLKFYDYARNYREAREQLSAMDMDAGEKAILEELALVAQFTQPLVRQVAERLLEASVPSNYPQLFTEASARQEELLALLDESIELQKQYANEALDAAQQKFNYTMASFLLLLTVLLTIGALTARVVVYYAGNKNKALALKNLELQNARARADEATRAKSEFLANMSHEIRTPLTTIIGFSETLTDPDLKTDDRRRAVTAIQNSGRHLYDIINDVLDISKIEAGKLEMESIPVSPLDLVKDAVCIMEQKASERGLQLRTEFHWPLPKTIHSDPTRLKQILLNLCGNAVKFTPSGTITLGLSLDAPARRVVFTVTDTGIGMSEEQVEQVFAPFRQADKSTTRNFGGTGLGLSISQQLARRLGGDITCSSRLGEGTCFTVTVDAGEPSQWEWLEPEETQNEVCVTPTLQVAPPRLQGRVLLAEDTADIQALLVMLLQKAGLTVDTVDNGAAALRQVRDAQYDIILMDMQMPVMDGLTAMAQLRDSGVDRPIVALSANASQRDRQRCLQAGANDFVVKPVDVAQLYEVLQRYVSPAAPAAEPSVQPQCAPSVQPLSGIDLELQQMVDSFVSRLPDTVGEITTYYRQKQWPELAASSHRLKGAGGAFGFPELSVISQQIMEQVRQPAGGEEPMPELPKQELRELIDRLNQTCRQITKKAG